ncbi:hypothetical protein BDW62DRAFT_204206 [Aspergillus aurantiobrunneus]
MELQLQDLRSKPRRRRDSGGAQRPAIYASNSTSPQQTSQPGLKLRASSKHLSLACPHFARMFKDEFREGSELRSNGSVELVVDHPNGIAFLILMLIVHCHTRQVPRVISNKMQTNIAVLVDYYVCYAAVEVFSDMWIAAIENDPVRFASDSLEWVFITWKKLNNNQTSYTQLLVEDLHKLHATAVSGCLLPIGSYQIDSTPSEHDLCSSSVFGALTKRLKQLNVVQKPEDPFEGFQIWKLPEKYRENMRSPESGRGYSKHDACRLSTRVQEMLKSYKDPTGFDLDAGIH